MTVEHKDCTIFTIGSKILVSVFEEPEEQEDGKLRLIVPDIAKEKKNEGKVVAVGKDNQEVKVGDTCVFHKHVSTEIEVEGMKFHVVPYDGILVIVRRKDNERA